MFHSKQLITREVYLILALLRIFRVKMGTVIIMDSKNIFILIYKNLKQFILLLKPTVQQ